MTGLARLVSEDIPGIFLYYAYQPVFVYVSALRGPDPGSAGTQNFWNIHEWELR